MNDDFGMLDRVKIAYKKLKAAVYFDKTLLPLRDRLVSFETSDIEDKLTKLSENIDCDEEDWNVYVDELLEKIDLLVYPKKLVDVSKNQIIFNSDNEPIELEKAQYFIDLPIEAHILSILWVMKVGSTLENFSDDETPIMYEHSYGNRLRKSLFNPETQDITYSPSLFEPYFSQYENWRDKALKYAKERLDDKQDAIILTLDLKSFFYSVHIAEDDFEEIIRSLEENEAWIVRIHRFIYQVLKKYSELVRKASSDPELQISERTILPIGFYPSNIISNWVLTPFDSAIVRRFNPVYYGRYVDDIIIVDKVEKNSPLRKKAQGRSDEKLTIKNVIDYYFRACASNRIVPEYGACNQELFTPVPQNELTPKELEVYRRENTNKNEETVTVFRINPEILSSNNKTNVKSDIRIQNSKVKVFYFREGATRALLDCFRTQIGQNASEFRHLPDMDAVLERSDYSEIFQLNNTETLHKLRGVSGVSIDKFSLSKFLGKYRKVGGMIRDKKENAFEKDLFAIMDNRTLIENYTLWERLLEIMVVNDRLDSYERLVKNIIKAIDNFQIPEFLVRQVKSYSNKWALLLTLKSAIHRTSALCWGEKINKVLTNIFETFLNNHPELLADVNSIEISNYFDDKRKLYCCSKMVNKYVIPLPIGCIDESVFNEKKSNIRLCKLDDILEKFNVNWELSYYYFPYMVTPQEISFALACGNIENKDKIVDPQAQLEKIKNLYKKLNYPNLGESKDANIDKIEAKSIMTLDKNKHHYIHVKSEESKTIRVAIGNARLYENDFKMALTGKANRSYERYNQLSSLIKTAIKEKVELLVLPENYLPWEWVPDIARLCANNQMAIITGIEHIVSPRDEDGSRGVYNLTAVILPYREDEYNFAHVVYHQKVHYSPEEKRMIEGYRFITMPGDGYQLFHWKDLWFSVYCCYELASIHERALFQSFADLTVAVEWNKDINYFSSIIESMCRDLHCYCIQANSSEYGDSRVMAPTKSETRDIIKTKGGKNSTILVDEIDICALRDFQYKEYELQRQDGRFKPTPPNFETSIIEHKQNKTLLNYLRNL